MFQRYAVYFTPDGALAEFGAAWLGWDSATAQPVTHPDCGSLDIAAVTQRPRRYGFHATIKPPFHLAQGQSVDALTRALKAACEDQPPVSVGALKLARLGSFLALVPKRPSAELTGCAANVVQKLDKFRAPPDKSEQARRRRPNLTPSQESNLSRWGYPHVGQDFRFHMTLTGPMNPEKMTIAKMVLERMMRKEMLAALTICSLTLCGQDDDDMFHQIKRFHLGGS